jgi:hypothetical protein
MAAVQGHASKGQKGAATTVVAGVWVQREASYCLRAKKILGRQLVVPSMYTAEVQTEPSGPHECGHQLTVFNATASLVIYDNL